MNWYRKVSYSASSSHRGEFGTRTNTSMNHQKGGRKRSFPSQSSSCSLRLCTSLTSTQVVPHGSTPVPQLFVRAWDRRPANDAHHTDRRYGRTDVHTFVGHTPVLQRRTKGRSNNRKHAHFQLPPSTKRTTGPSSFSVLCFEGGWLVGLTTFFPDLEVEGIMFATVVFPPLVYSASFASFGWWSMIWGGQWAHAPCVRVQWVLFT